MRVPSKLLLALTILLWSLTPMMAAFALVDLDPFQLLFWTSLVSVVVLGIVGLAMGKLKTLNTKSLRDYLIMFGMGALGIFFYYLLYYGALSFAPVGQANIINYLWPSFVVVFSIPLLHEKTSWKTAAATLLSLSGAAIIISGGDLSGFSGSHVPGYLLALCAAVCYGLFSVLGKKLDFERYSSMFVYYITAFLLIVPVSLLVSGFAVPRSWLSIMGVLFLGGLSNSIGFVLWFLALKEGDTHRTAIAIFLVPCLALVWAVLFNKEVVPITALVGLGLVLGGIAISMSSDKKK
ncbi:MAG: DMT family transporter [archaeon]